MTAPGTSTVRLADGTIVSLADWIDDKVYSMWPDDGPKLTGDGWRWPDVAAAGGWRKICAVGRVTGRDLRQAVARVYAQWRAAPSAENAWALANVIDAAVDEQDRRAGRPPRGPRPAPLQIEPFIVGRAATVPSPRPAQTLQPDVDE